VGINANLGVISILFHPLKLVLLSLAVFWSTPPARSCAFAAIPLTLLDTEISGMKPMKARVALTLFAHAILVVTSAQAQTPTQQDADALSRLAGAWRVVKVGVRPAPVQALVENDPEDMGAVLDIAPERLSWRPGKGAAFTDVCESPRLAADGSIGCAKGAFGYAGAKLKVIGSRIRLDWYDNAILTLKRQ